MDEFGVDELTETELEQLNRLFVGQGESLEQYLRKAEAFVRNGDSEREARGR